MNNKSDSVATQTKPAAPRPQGQVPGQARPQARQPGAQVSKAPAPNGREDVVHRNDFYRDGNKKMYVAAGIALIALVLQVFVAYLGFTAKNERVYFATDKNGSLIKLWPLGQPNQKDEVVAQWMQNALVDTFSFNFTNMTPRLSESTMQWFTPSGREQFLSEMKSSGHMDVVNDGRMIMSLTLDHTPVLYAKPAPAPDTGIYTWRMQADAVLTFRTQSKEYSKKVRFTVAVERRSVLDNVQGLGIAKIVMTNR